MDQGGMMDYSNENEKKQFTAALTGLAAIFRHEIKREVYALYWEAFKDCELTDFLAACKAHMSKGKFFPVPAELFALMPLAEHVGCEEAWALALESFDEFATVVLTQQIAEARGVAWGLYADGDKVAARMAFKEAYNRIIKTAEKPKWYISRGFDNARMEAAIAKAVQLGRLPAGSENQCLPAPATYAGLIEGAKKHSGIDASEIIQKLKPLLTDNASENRAANAEKRRNDFEAHRNSELNKLSKKL